MSSLRTAMQDEIQDVPTVKILLYNTIPGVCLRFRIPGGNSIVF